MDCHSGRFYPCSITVPDADNSYGDIDDGDCLGSAHITITGNSTLSGASTTEAKCIRKTGEIPGNLGSTEL